MKRMLGGLLGLGLLVVGVSGAIAQGRNATFSGQVQRVWEDGFRLKTEARIITVDTYDLCGDHTSRHLKVGEQVTVTGEFDGGEFDAFTLTRVNGSRVCR